MSNMTKYLVVSPTFGDFRAGEPTAFSIAEAALEAMCPTEIVKQGAYNGHRVELNHDNTEISVWLHNDERPFKFIVVEV